MKYSKKPILDVILSEIAIKARSIDQEVSTASMLHNLASPTDKELNTLLNILQKSGFFLTDREKAIGALREIKSGLNAKAAEDILPEEIFREISRNPIVDFLSAKGDILSEEGKEILRGAPDWMIKEAQAKSPEFFSAILEAMLLFKKSDTDKDLYSKILESDRWGNLFSSQT